MLILPKPDALTQPYWDGAKRHQLLLQRCDGCQATWHPPLPICPKCRAKGYTWTPIAGGGTIYSYTEVHHPAHVAVADKVPYLVALVTLDEGPRVVTNILDCALTDISVGMRVELTFQTIAPDVVLPQFRLVASARQRADDVQGA